MEKPQTDNCCTLLGWTEYTATIGFYDLHFSVAPETDLNDTFTAFCHDEQELLKINGWNLENIEEILPAIK